MPRSDHGSTPEFDGDIRGFALDDAATAESEIEGDQMVVFRSISSQEARQVADALRHRGIDCAMESERLLDPTDIANIHVVEEPRYVVVVPEHLSTSASSVLDELGISSELDPEELEQLLTTQPKPWARSLRLLVVGALAVGLVWWVLMVIREIW
jgi:hypothetical protein